MTKSVDTGICLLKAVMVLVSEASLNWQAVPVRKGTTLALGKMNIGMR